MPFSLAYPKKDEFQSSVISDEQRIYRTPEAGEARDSAADGSGFALLLRLAIVMTNKEEKVSVAIREVIDSFDLLFQSILNRKFSKSLRLHEWGEKDLLPLIRTYLLGYFGESIVPEAKTILPGALSGNGRIDFLVDNVAVEFAVRKPTAAKSNVSASVNSSEAKKLIKYDGPAVLVLFDFSKTPYTSIQIESFRNWPSLGRGNHRKSAFNVAYYYIKSRRPLATDVIKKCIRVF